MMYYAAGVRPQNVILKRVLRASDSWNAEHYNSQQVTDMINKANSSFRSG